MTFITKKHLPRRTFLRSAGVTVGIPLLSAMVPAMTPLAKAQQLQPKRFVGVWHPQGAAPGYWSPAQAGSDFEFSYITKPLEPFRKYTTLISGLDAFESFPTEEEPAGDHARMASMLSGVRPVRSAVSPYLGVTIDQLIAEKYGRDTILSSLQLGIEDAGNYGNCNWGYSCAYTNSLSWPDPVSPLPTEINPRIAFERLFGDGASAEDRRRGREKNASVLDSLSAAIPDLKKGLGAGDKVRLDGYLNNVRELERRIQIAMNSSVAEPSEEVPFGIPQVKDDHFKLMFDLIALAFEADLTRSATMMLGRDLSSTSFPESGFNGGWHGSSHHGDKPDNIASYAMMNRYHVSMTAYFLDKMMNIQEGEGNLLDTMLLYQFTNMGNSHRHAHEKIPTILVGGVNGFEGNRHIFFEDTQTEGDNERASNLLWRILQQYDIEVESFGAAQHPLPIA